MTVHVPGLPQVGPAPAVHATGGGDIAAPGAPSPVEQPAVDGETVHSPSAATSTGSTETAPVEAAEGVSAPSAAPLDDWYEDFSQAQQELERVEQNLEDCRTRIDQIIDSILTLKIDRRLFGWLVPTACAPPALAAEIASILGEREEFAATYYDDTYNVRHWTLVSRMGGLDVATLARQKGGDGTPFLATFTADLNDRTTPYVGHINRAYDPTPEAS